MSLKRNKKRERQKRQDELIDFYNEFILKCKANTPDKHNALYIEYNEAWKRKANVNNHNSNRIVDINANAFKLLFELRNPQPKLQEIKTEDKV